MVQCQDASVRFLLATHHLCLYKYYFTCNICHSELQWRVNGDDAAAHNAGTITRYNDLQTATSQRRVEHMSLLYSWRLPSGQVCLTALLIVSDEEFKDVMAECRGGDKRGVVTYTTQQGLSNVSRQTQGNSELDYVLHEVMTPSFGRNARLSVYMCHTTDAGLPVFLNGSLISNFTQADSLGAEKVQLDPDNSSMKVFAVCFRNDIILTTLLLLQGGESDLEVQCGTQTTRNPDTSTETTTISDFFSSFTSQLPNSTWFCVGIKYYSYVSTRHYLFYVVKKF